MFMTRLAIGLAIAGVAHSAIAQQTDGRTACRADVAQFCAGVRPGGGRIDDCLIDHQKDISDACYDHLGKRLPAADGQGGNAPGGPPPPFAGAVYRSQQANGRVIYSDTRQSNVVAENEVRFLRGNGALPPR